MIRKATNKDIPGIVKIYDKILDREEEGKTTIGWERGVYPTEQTAMDAISNGDMFVLEQEEEILAAARINQIQMPAYAEVDWEYKVPDTLVTVLHTLVVAPWRAGEGIGTEFVRYYEEYAIRHESPYLRMDTNERNSVARQLYQKLGYTEAGVVPCVFNGIEGVHLVCLEKKAEQKIKD